MAHSFPTSLFKMRLRFITSITLKINHTQTPKCLLCISSERIRKKNERIEINDGHDATSNQLGISFDRLKTCCETEWSWRNNIEIELIMTSKCQNWLTKPINNFGHYFKNVRHSALRFGCYDSVTLSYRTKFNIFIWVRDVCNSWNMQNNNELIYFDMIKYGSGKSNGLCVCERAFVTVVVISIFVSANVRYSVALYMVSSM